MATEWAFDDYDEEGSEDPTRPGVELPTEYHDDCVDDWASACTGCRLWADNAHAPVSVPSAPVGAFEQVNVGRPSWWRRAVLWLRWWRRDLDRDPVHFHSEEETAIHCGACWKNPAACTCNEAPF